MMEELKDMVDIFLQLTGAFIALSCVAGLLVFVVYWVAHL